MVRIVTWARVYFSRIVEQLTSLSRGAAARQDYEMQNPIDVLYGPLAFLLSLAATCLETRSIRAVIAHEAGDPDAAERAARSDVATWAAGVIGLYTAVEHGWWILVPEGIGLYIGTKLALRT